MPFSYVLLPGNGSATTFGFSFGYLSKAHIGVKVNGVTTAFTWLTDFTMSISPAPANGAVVEIRRVTPKDQPIVDWSDGSTLTEADMDLNTRFALYCAQEAQDGVDASIRQDSLGVWDGQGRRATNFADPQSPQDLATKQWSETAMFSQLAQATTQATAAAGRATAAAGSATAAANSASAAATSEANALASKNAAATSATNAATSESNANASKNAAATSASNAAGSATAAANSATAAATSEANALASKNAAATSEANAAASLFTFKSQYLGALSSAPTVDGNGNPVTTGDLYFNTTENAMKVFSGSVWQSVGSVINSVLKPLDFVATAGQSSINIVGGYEPSFCLVYVNGSKLTNGVDVDVSSGTNLVFSVPLSAGDEVSFIGFGMFNVANTYTKVEADAKYVAKAGDALAGRLSWDSFTDTGPIRINADMGGSFVDWKVSRPYAVQVDAANNNSAYGLVRWTKWGERHLAAIDAFAGGTSVSVPYIAFHVGATDVAFQMDGGGNFTAKGNIGAYSDVRLKVNIETIPGALEKVLSLRGVTYNRVDVEADERHMGLLAQDVQEVAPETVMVNPDGYLSVNYGALVGLLVEAIKELKAEVDELKKGAA